MPFIFQSPDELRAQLGERIRLLRMGRELRQSDLAERAGVSLKVVRRLELTGAGSMDSLVRIAFALGVEAQFNALFETPPATLADLVDDAPVRHRVRLKR